MVTVYVKHQSFTDCLSGYDPDDDWSRDSFSTSWDFGGLGILREGQTEEITISAPDVEEGQKVFVTVAVWSTGDSFGRDEDNYAEAFSVHKSYEAAKKAVEVMESAKGVLDRPKEGYDLGDGYKLSYAPWDGYFESLSYIKIVEGYL